METGETKRLIIRDFKIDDAPFVKELLNDPGWIKYIGERNIKSLKDAENYITDKFFKAYDKYDYAMHVIIDKETHKSIGTIGINHRSGLKHPDLGFAFLSDHTGKGYGYESSVYMLTQAFDKYSIDVMSAITSPENIISQKLLIKLGFIEQAPILLPQFDQPSSYFLLYKN